MWERSKNNSVLTSWEEFAFARDSYSDVWGCVWPPRSYSCSFCWREFRSAQALGGHMNVHRRDRARLKLEGSSSSNEEENPNPNPNPNPNSAEVSIDLKLGEMDCKRKGEGSNNYCKKLKRTDDISKLRTCQVEELDLELRLGDSPKLKRDCSIIMIE